MLPVTTNLFKNYYPTLSRGIKLKLPFCGAVVSARRLLPPVRPRGHDFEMTGQGRVDGGLKPAGWDAVAPFPSCEGARINANLRVELALRDTACLSEVYELLSQSVTFGERVEPQEPDHPHHVINARLSVFPFPIHNAHLIAANYFRGIDLAEFEVQAALPNGLANRLRTGRVARP